METSYAFKSFRRYSLVYDIKQSQGKRNCTCLSQWLSTHVAHLRICQALLVFTESNFSANAIKIMLKLTGEQLNGWMTRRSFKHKTIVFYFYT
jgi:hypothetical protein